MKKSDLLQKNCAANLDSNSKPQPNPYTLFLILILLINSFGEIGNIVRNIKGILLKEEEG
ncbi:MAG: hypothetical protein PHE70_11405 [Tepidanaerobacteraceae bacterium]|nr:hypothetical protein [Tepidanaerobacteraceae bacterium]